MDAENFYIALYDADRQAINFPYYVDTVDTDIPDPAAWDPIGEGDAAGSTAYVLRTGQPAAPGRGGARRTSSRAARSRPVGAPSDRRLGRRAARRRGRDARRDRRPVLRRRPPPHGRRTSTCWRSSASTSAPRSAGSARSRRPASATPSWPSSTRSASPSGASSNTTRSSSSSVNACGRCSTPSRCSSRPTTSATQLITFPYEIDEGKRLQTEPFSLGPGLTSIVIRDARATPPGARGGGGRARVPSPAAPSPTPGSASRSSAATGHRRHLPRGRRAERLRRVGRAAARARSPRAWPSPSRARACSTRPSAC